ncbi:hypothetical protein [Aeromicrobium sp. UC242_57]|uniref:hypothetical protein n=1 Tax=Aeromicrobium sp. UC242_57 TaxID=3374624 RepID=UPI0037B2E304
MTAAESLPEWLRPLEKLVTSVEAAQLSPNFTTVPDDARPAAVLMLFSDGPHGPAAADRTGQDDAQPPGAGGVPGRQVRSGRLRRGRHGAA